MSFASSYLSSPVIKLTIPPTPGVEGDGKLYTVHRSLLKSHTNLLHTTNVKPRSTCISVPHNTPPGAFEAILEFIYTGNYELQEQHVLADHHTDADAKPAPVVQAAMQGAIGVWGKPAAVHDDTPNHNISSYQSELFPDIRNEYSSPAQPGSALAPSLPTPPESPSFPAVKPVVVKVKKLVYVGTSTPVERMNAHLDIYVLARRYAVADLPELALENVSQEVTACPAILRDLVRRAYTTKHRIEDLRLFVLQLVQTNWEDFKKDPEFQSLLMEGGEFVIDVLWKVKTF